MKKTVRLKLLLFALCAMPALHSFAQLLPELNYPTVQYEPKTWPSFWINCADAPFSDYSVTLYRRTFEVAEKPGKFIVHVSADNRYKLFVNGKLASIGPQLSDPKHWRYETIDIAPYLNKGTNTLAAEVANWGPDRFFGIMSVRTGFYMLGNAQNESVVNTDSKWKAHHNKAYSPLYLNWIYGVDIVGGFYASNPGDSLQLSQYPENWNSADFDDTGWENARTIWRTDSDRGSGHFWLMKARTTPQVVQHEANFSSVARSSGINVPGQFLQGEQELVVPANTKCSFLLDYKTVTLGFPELTVSGGKGAKITIRYAENLLTPDLKKGDRNVVEGKAIRGIHDVIMPDGRSNFVFSPLWYRGFRYVQLDIETDSEPLVLNRFKHIVTQSQMPIKAKFECDDAEYMKIDEICRRTAEICTQDNLMSDAYYEQMMYVADSKIHALVNLCLSGDPVWLKNAIEQFGFSQAPSGVITGCYPVKGPMHHTNFTLYWIDMMHDYMMYCPEDKEFLLQYVNGIRSAFDLFENGMLENGLIGNTIGKCFIDWYNEPAFPGQRSWPGSANGNSAIITLQYATTLIYAAEILEYLGLPSEAKLYRERAEKVKKTVYQLCWDNERQLFAENPDKKFFDERANIQAIACEMFDRETQKALFDRCVADTTISKAGYFFRFKHFEQMRKLGKGDQLDQLLGIWKEVLALNLTTTPERQARQRSDAHPWSASPAMAFLNIAAGIAPAEPNFKSVKIEPAFGKLNYIKASYPHFLGDIQVELKKNAENSIEGTVTLPAGLSGNFEYKGKKMVLKEGENRIKP